MHVVAWKYTHTHIDRMVDLLKLGSRLAFVAHTNTATNNFNVVFSSITERYRKRKHSNEN